jgi:hypothetical protein
MWMVKNNTPYAAERTWVQDKDGNKIWMVVVKATYDISPGGQTRLADAQELPLRLGRHFGEPYNSSLIYESDLNGLKPNTDVLVNGCAYAPSGKQVPNVDVQLAVGPIKKRLRVFGERVWESRLVGGPSISAPQAFESMPIRYERAFGGWDRAADYPKDHRLDARNPVGTAFAIKAAHCVGSSLPNVEYPNGLIGSWKDHPQPAGFGAIECHWSPRRELAGTYDERWQKERFPLWAQDFDSSYNNCAPADQQARGYLRGGESVELINFTPSGRLAFQLPKVYPFFETRFGRKKIEHRAKLCTVIIEPEHPRLIMAWQTSLMCNHEADELDMTIVSEKRMVLATE